MLGRLHPETLRGIARTTAMHYKKTDKPVDLIGRELVRILALQNGVAWDAAGNYMMTGDNARALDWLEKAGAERDPGMPYSGCLPIFDALRAEPRFLNLLRRMNLPQ